MARKAFRWIMSLVARPARIDIVPCTVHAGCFRWVITSADGKRSECSPYAYASVSGARAASEIRHREIGGKV
jgi:hypothetical protein